MKKILPLILGILIGATAMFFLEIAAQKRQAISIANGATRYNCELSGGTMEGSSCTCPLELEQTQSMMYDAATGFCQTTFGGPGGAAFYASVGLPHGDYAFWNEIIGNLCTKSGGTVSGAACICKSSQKYNKTTGQCR